MPFTTTTVQAVGTTDAGNYNYVSVHTTTQGTSSNIIFQGSNDNTNWVSVVLLNASATGSISQNISTSGAARIDSGPLNFRYFRLNVTGISAGTTAGTIIFRTQAPPMIAQSTNVGTISAVVNVGQQTSNTSAVQLSATSTVPTNGIVIEALIANAAVVYIGGSGVTTSTGFQLSPGQSLTLTCNLNTIYVIGSNATDKVCWSVA